MPGEREEGDLGRGKRETWGEGRGRPGEREREEGGLGRGRGKREAWGEGEGSLGRGKREAQGEGSSLGADPYLPLIKGW